MEGDDVEQRVIVERRQDRREPSREHRLPRPGRPDEKEVVSPRRRDLEGALRDALPDHLGEVGERLGVGGDRHLGPLGELPRAQRGHELAEAMRRHEAHVADERGLGEVRLGEHEGERAGVARRAGERQCAAKRAHAPVEPELAGEEEVPHRIGLELSAGDEHADRHREVEGRALLPDVGG